MSTQSILGWVACVTANLLPSRSRTLAAPVAAAVRCERVNLATVGRKMAGPVAAKRTIKRAWRFTCDRRVEVTEAMAGAVKRVARRRKKPLLVGFDWTDVRGFHTLMAAACIGGRAVPLVRASYTGSKLKRSQDGLEERPLRELRGLIPASAPAIILADRGFGRAEWAAACQELGSRSVVRIKPDVAVACPRYRGVLRKSPATKGLAHVLRGVAYRKDRRVEHDVVVRWRPGLPEKRDGPWSLMTDLDGRAERLCDLCGRRMSVGELLRDHEGRRDGQSLRGTRITYPDRFDRLLIVVALAYLLLVGIGLRAKLDHDPAAWCTTRRARECSVFTIGKAMVDRVNCPPDHLLQMVRWATIEVGSKWG